MENTTSAEAGGLARLPQALPLADQPNPELIKVLRAEEILAQTPSLAGEDAEHSRHDTVPPARPVQPGAAQ